jgi:hypothetical protein
MTWVELDPPESVTGVSGLPSANSVYGNAVVGIVLGESGSASYQAQVNVGFQLSNVVSGNRGHGVAIVGANDNEVAMNNIGTSFAGTAAVPNRGNGILVTNRSSGNLIGGQATGGNAPVSYSGSTPVFVRPPQGNLVSGNRGNGILLTGGATGTTLSGNFVGTTPSGTAALGNGQDGVAIVGASGNSLIGTTFPQNPFVFYNVLSGNSGNGLRITNSNDTTVWANFMGLGANNATTVANGGNGLLVSGTSQRTLVGGPIPMGNGISGNNRHGIHRWQQPDSHLPRGRQLWQRDPHRRAGDRRADRRHLRRHQQCDLGGHPQLRQRHPHRWPGPRQRNRRVPALGGDEGASVGQPPLRSGDHGQGPK